MGLGLATGPAPLPTKEGDTGALNSACSIRDALGLREWGSQGKDFLAASFDSLHVPERPTTRGSFGTWDGPGDRFSQVNLGAVNPTRGEECYRSLAAGIGPGRGLCGSQLMERGRETVDRRQRRFDNSRSRVLPFGSLNGRLGIGIRICQERPSGSGPVPHGRVRDRFAN
jgi:hypothetical protein